MRPKVALVSGFSSWSGYLGNILRKVFSDEIEVIEYNSDRNLIHEPVVADLILITQAITYYSGYRFFNPSTPTINLSMTFTKQQCALLRSIPAGTKVLIVNDEEQATAETISAFQRLGLTHLDYYPYSAAMITDEAPPTIAITPGESQLVPDYIKQTIDIGPRVINPHCITEIAVYLGLEHLLKSGPIMQYLSEIGQTESGLSYLLDRTRAADEIFLSLADTLGEGIIILDKSGMIQNCNQKATRLLGNRKEIIGQPIGQLLPCSFSQNIKQLTEDSSVQLISINGTNVTLRIIPIHVGDNRYGAIAEINIFEEKERQQLSLRQQLLKKGHVAKRTFNDIITQNSDMQNLKILAEKHAKSTATILITGESGTGKEVLAQAIHNASTRRSGPFVALNCAALPKELLESELFGYEDGAFTGAKKGGKIGLFELASSGTIFLDEIGDMDLETQARILRVLEEREILQIGGNTMRAIDIRVIAATNQNLQSMMEQGEFRKDLYYRLSVIPLELPPLRNRPDDILLLLSHFKRINNSTFALSPQAEQYLIDYPWYGNIREMKNLAEYLSVMNLEYLDVSDIQQALHSKHRLQTSSSGAPHAQSKSIDTPSHTMSVPRQTKEMSPDLSSLLQQFSTEISGDQLSYYVVLKSLSTRCGHGVSRRDICLDARGDGCLLSEMKIRTAISMLAKYGFVAPGSGRLGSRITPLGIAAFERIQQDPYLKEMLCFLEKRT